MTTPKLLWDKTDILPALQRAWVKANEFVADKLMTEQAGKNMEHGIVMVAKELGVSDEFIAFNPILPPKKDSEETPHV